MLTIPAALERRRRGGRVRVSTQSSCVLKCFPTNNILEVGTCEYLVLKECLIPFHGDIEVDIDNVTRELDRLREWFYTHCFLLQVIG